MERQHTGCRSRSDAAKLHQEDVQKLMSKGYQRHVNFDVIVDLLGETPMTGRILRTDGLPKELPHSAKLVRPASRPSPEVDRYLSCRKKVKEANHTAWATRSEVVKHFDKFLGFGAVAETLHSWKKDLNEVNVSKKQPDPVKILLYGSTGEGKSALVSALLDMPGIAPSDCAGTAVTSCTMIYCFRHHAESEALKPESENSHGWAQWLSQISRDKGTTGAESAWSKYGAKVHFLSPSAFKEQRNQLVDSIADYWLNDRKERMIRAKLPPNDQHEAYFATQTLHEWYGDHLFAVASWKNRIDFLRYLEAKDPQIKALQILFGNLRGDKITFENGAAIYTLEEDDPLAFCDQLRGWVTVSASQKMAPFLSHVQVFLPNPALRGVTLIDAAGLGDDNRQRREMAASLVATADFVWVLAKISRGLSNQLARKMLRSLSRKVLLDKNSEGEITFILTHSDVLNESEIAKRGGGSRKKLALQRAREVPFKFAQDMESELWHSDGNQVGSASTSSILGAFAVSATDYLRVQGFDTYEPLTFDKQEETQVPMVRQQMLMQALKRQCDADRTPLNQMCGVLKRVVAHLSDPGTEEENRRAKCESIVQRHVSMYKELVTQILSSWEASAMEELHHTLASKIQQGASKGAAAAEATSNEWAVHSNYHHATYKGMVRRGCTWDHPSRGHLDWPEELAEPVYKNFSKNWRDLFGTKLPQQASDVKTKLHQAMQRLHVNIQREVVQGRCRPEAEVVALQEGLDFSSSVSARLDAMLVHVKRHSANVTGKVQEQVVQSLTKASSQCADSNYARQKHFISQAATSIKFEESAVGMVQGLSVVEQEVKHCSVALRSELCKLAESGYRPLWRKMTPQEKFEWQKLQQELLPDLKKQLEPLEVARCCVEDVHAKMIKTLKDLMPRKAAAASAARPVDDGQWANFLELKKPRAMLAQKRPAPIEDGQERPEQPEKVSKSLRENPK